MKSVAPLLIALTVCAVTAIIGAVFIEHGLLRALFTGVGAVVAILIFRKASRKYG